MRPLLPLRADGNGKASAQKSAIDMMAAAMVKDAWNHLRVQWGRAAKALAKALKGKQDAGGGDVLHHQRLLLSGRGGLVRGAKSRDGAPFPFPLEQGDGSLVPITRILWRIGLRGQGVKRVKPFNLLPAQGGWRSRFTLIPTSVLRGLLITPDYVPCGSDAKLQLWQDIAQVSLVTRASTIFDLAISTDSYAVRVLVRRLKKAKVPVSRVINHQLPHMPVANDPGYRYPITTCRPMGVGEVILAGEARSVRSSAFAWALPWVRRDPRRSPVNL